jgi:multidrug transporter EmrE-like cation transporter
VDQLFLASAILLNIVSYTIYKGITGLEPKIWWPLFLLGLFLGAINTYLFARSLKTIQLAVAYPVFSAGCIALITVVSLMVFKERLRPVNFVGLGVVVVGIVLVSISK